MHLGTVEQVERVVGLAGLAAAQAIDLGAGHAVAAGAGAPVAQAEGLALRLETLALGVGQAVQRQGSEQQANLSRKVEPFALVRAHLVAFEQAVGEVMTLGVASDQQVAAVQQGGGGPLQVELQSAGAAQGQDLRGAGRGCRCLGVRGPEWAGEGRGAGEAEEDAQQAGKLSRHVSAPCALLAAAAHSSAAFSSNSSLRASGWFLKARAKASRFFAMKMPSSSTCSSFSDGTAFCSTSASVSASLQHLVVTIGFSLVHEQTLLIPAAAVHHFDGHSSPLCLLSRKVALTGYPYSIWRLAVRG